MNLALTQIQSNSISGDIFFLLVVRYHLLCDLADHRRQLPVQRHS